jgi:hypothetical protein
MENYQLIENQGRDSLKPPTYYFAISLVVVLFIILLDSGYRESLFNASLSDIERI